MKGPLKASYRYAAGVARREAKNFYPCFWLLPPDRRRAMCALYAFLRRTDDIADEDSNCSKVDALQKLATWRSDLDRALAGNAADSWQGWPALADSTIRHGIPPVHLHDAVLGAEMDLLGNTYTTFDELYSYCYRVASTVGLACLHIWGYQSHGGRAEKLAEECGIALQLTNILRDVREDAMRGRVYLPKEDLDRFQVDPSTFSEMRVCDRSRALFAFEAQRAYKHYESADELIPLVHPSGRAVLSAIVGVYRSLLDEICKRKFDVQAGRISLSKSRKLAILLSSLVGVRARKRPATTPSAPGL